MRHEGLAFPGDLLTAGGRGHVLSDPDEHVYDVLARRVYVLEQHSGIQAVTSRTVCRHRTRSRGIGQDRTGGGVHLGQTLVSSPELAEGVVAAGVQNYDVDVVPGVFHGRQNVVRPDALIFDVYLFGNVRVHRQEIVDAVHLQTVAGIKKQAYAAFAYILQKIPD